MNFRSHSKNEVKAALSSGCQAWALDTTTGDDDVLLGSAEDVLRDVLEHFELPDLPSGWELTRIHADWLD